MTCRTMIGVALAKNIFQLQGALFSGEVKLRRTLFGQHFRSFMIGQGASTVLMEACGSAHYRSCKMMKFGHEVRQRAEMRVVTPKLEEQQAQA